MAPRRAAAKHRMITSCFMMYMIDLCEDTYFRVINQRNEEYFTAHANYCVSSSFSVLKK